jgi:hypothetical protein
MNAGSFRCVAPAILIAFAGSLYGQPPDHETPPLTAARRAAIIDAVGEKLLELYVYPDIARTMEQRIRDRRRAGAYDHLVSLERFVAALNEDLLAVYPDGHLEVTVLPEARAQRASDDQWWQDHVERSRYENFGFRRIEWLPGNLGLLRIDGFDYPEIAGEATRAAMALLAHTDAVIIDLRRNPGGRGELAQVLLSYFFEDHRVHYLTEHDGVRNITRQWWTMPYVPGTRRPDVPLYVLTGPNTGSAAEEFAFVLQNLGRATLVGETTAGAAHKTHRHPYPELHIEIHMPDGRSFDPATGRDWEGTGVVPDVEAPAAQALDVARALALAALLDGEGDDHRRFRLEWAKRELDATLRPVRIDEASLRQYAGVYGPRRITVEDGTLYYQRDRRPKFRLSPLGDDWFRLEGLPYFRIRFARNDAGAITGLVGVYDDGTERSTEKAQRDQSATNR